MGDDFFIGRLVILQHVLDQIDAATRRIQFVALDQIGRAGGAAKSAMHTIAQNFLCFIDFWVGQLGIGEVGLHFMRCPHTRGRD